MKNFQFLILVLLLIGCSNADSRKPKEDIDPKFTANASINEIHESIKYTVSEYDFSVIFFMRDDSNHSWYKMFSKRVGYWEKIEIRQVMIDEDQLRKDPDYYIQGYYNKKTMQTRRSRIFFKQVKSLECI